MRPLARRGGEKIAAEHGRHCEPGRGRHQQQWAADRQPQQDQAGGAAHAAPAEARADVGQAGTLQHFGGAALRQRQPRPAAGPTEVVARQPCQRELLQVRDLDRLVRQDRAALLRDPRTEVDLAAAMRADEPLGKTAELAHVPVPDHRQTRVDPAQRPRRGQGGVADPEVLVAADQVAQVRSAVVHREHAPGLLPLQPADRRRDRRNARHDVGVEEHQRLATRRGR